MNYLVCYDVNTLTPEGRRRLRHVATACKNYGQRVQFSVFECTVNATQFEQLRQRLLAIIHPQQDSLRIYRLGPDRAATVEAHGRDGWTDFTAPLVV